ncbi:tape measure protein [Arthrobacter phage Shambre1]|uniref:Tape measure protein n=1 Tax=Arthrobacter phage Shambre1 TaxID=2927284 RepID=A0A977PRZ5_9CAUD|nr:tape measure protein [Arthrobacter phage Shambre1]UXE04754.1 tape measure protein [Arthrobacter phage Shambre1]
MSVTLATAYVELIPTTRGIEGSVQRQFAPAVNVAERAGRESGDAFSNQAESRIRGAAGRIGSALRTTLTIAGGVMAAAGGIGLKTAADMEQSEIAFTTMLGTAKQAKAFLGDLNKFAAKTPFDLPGLQKSASSLISAGIEANKVIPIMTSLGNATSGMGTGSEGIARATVALQQMNAAGKIGAEDLNQLRDAGIPVFDLLTAATGKTKEEIAEMADKGKLGREELEQLMTALETGKGLERFNGLMEKQSASLGGMAATFKDTFSVGLAEAVKPAIPLLKDGLGGATTLLSDVVLPRVKTGLSEVVGGITAFGAAWEYNDGEITSSGFPGFMEHAGYIAHQAFDKGKQAVSAFTAAWEYNDGEVTSSGFNGWMERAGYFSRQLSDAVGTLDFSSVQGFLSSVNDVGGTTAPLLADIGGSLSALWPAVQEFAEQAPTLATGGLKLLTGALGFLADHVDTIIDWMPLIVAGFVAWRVAQIALNAAAAITPGIQLAVNISRIAAARAEMGLASAHRASAAAIATSTTATVVNGQAAATTTRQTIAQRAAQLGASIAARAAAVGQWLLNAALSANPIGIVVLAIAGLVAGLVWFFTQTEIGQQIVAAAWAGIQQVVGVVVDWFMTNVLPTVLDVIHNIGAVFQWLWNNVISPVFQFIGAAAVAVGMVLGKIFEIVVAVIRNVLGPAFAWIWNSVIKPVFGFIGALISAWWNGVVMPVFNGVVGFLRNTLGPAFTWLWKTIIKPAFDGIGAAGKWVWDNVLKPVFDKITQVVQKDAPKAFDTGVKAIKTAWTALQDAAKAPVKFVIDTVINKGLIAGINSIAGSVGVKPLPDVAMPAGWRHGGYTGDGPAHQVAGPVHKGEWVFTKEQTAAIGKENLRAAASAAVRGGAPAAGAALGAPQPGSLPFIWGPPQEAIARTGRLKIVPIGGFPMSTAQTAARAWNGRSGVKLSTGAFSGGFASNAVSMSYANLPGYAIGYYTGSSNGGAIQIEPGNALERETAIHEVGHALGLHHNTGNTSIMHPMLRGGGAVWPTPYDTANLQTLYGAPGAGVRPSADPGDTPDNPLMGLINGLVDKFKAAFPGGGTFADLAIGAGKTLFTAATDFISDKLGGIISGIKDIWNGLTGQKQVAGGALTGNPMLYDNGGYLQPGLSLVNNETGRPEPVMTSRQWRALETYANTGQGERGPVIGEQHIHTTEPAEVVGEYIARRIERKAIR